MHHSLFKITPLLLLASASSIAATPAGKTIITRGDVMAYEQEQSSRKLKRRSPIYNVDTVDTQANSKAQFRMSDGSLLAIKQNTTVNIAEYNYQQGAEDNSMVLELVKGGLRSVTGAIKENSGSYELKTPVGSIGIRGTHYEIEIISGEMFLAVWDGAIDLTVETGPGDDQTVSFGEGEDFSFGIVSEEGEVTQLLEPPDNFSQGHSDDGSGSDDDSDDQSNDDSDDSDNSEDGSEDSSSDGDSSSNGDSSSGDGSDNSDSNSNDGSDDGSDGGSNQGSGGPTGGSNTGQPIGNNLQTDSGSDSTTTTEGTNTANEDLGESLGESLNQETFDSLTPTPPEVVAAMQGSTTLSNIVESSVTGTNGDVSNLTVNMNINFDTTFVEGDFSATDNGGEWFAVYQGFIDQNQLSLGVTQATHGNELATGEIDGFFTDDARKVFSNFRFSELNNPNNSINGNFLVE